HAHREIYALYEIAQSMGTSLGVADTMALISSKLTKIIPWSGCALFLSQEDGNLKCRFAAGVDTPQLVNCTLKPGEGLSGWVARNKRTVVNGNPSATFEVLGLQTSRLKSAIVVPLHYNETFLGCLALYHVDANRYTDEHSRLIERVAEQASAVVHNSIVFEQTQEDSLTDPLTGLPNRRSMFVHLSRELDEHRAPVRQPGQRVGQRDFLRLLEHDRIVNDGAGLLGDALDQAAVLVGVPVGVDVVQRQASEERLVVVQRHDDRRLEARGLEPQDLERGRGVAVDDRPLVARHPAGQSLPGFERAIHELRRVDARREAALQIAVFLRQEERAARPRNDLRQLRRNERH